MMKLLLLFILLLIINGSAVLCVCKGPPCFTTSNAKYDIYRLIIEPLQGPNITYTRVVFNGYGMAYDVPGCFNSRMMAIKKLVFQYRDGSSDYITEGRGWKHIAAPELDVNQLSTSWDERAAAERRKYGLCYLGIGLVLIVTGLAYIVLFPVILCYPRGHQQQQQLHVDPVRGWQTMRCVGG
jgi:hypothetical protein